MRSPRFLMMKNRTCEIWPLDLTLLWALPWTPLWNVSWDLSGQVLEGLKTEKVHPRGHCAFVGALVGVNFRVSRALCLPAFSGVQKTREGCGSFRGLFRGSQGKLWASPGKIAGKCFLNREMLQILGFRAPGKANLPGTTCREPSVDTAGTLSPPSVFRNRQFQPSRVFLRRAVALVVAPANDRWFEAHASWQGKVVNLLTSHNKRAELKVTDLRWRSPNCGFLRFSAKIFGFLRKSAVSCALQVLEFPGEGVNLRKSAIFCESLRFGLSLSP